MNTSDHSNAEITSELASGEMLLWSGKPRQGIVFRDGDIFLIPFSVMWCGGAIAWETMVLSALWRSTHQNVPGVLVFFALWGIPFVLFGLYFSVGRFAFGKKRRERTIYAVTDQRVIILAGLFRRNTKSLDLRMLSDISLSLKFNGRGTITFGATNAVASMWYALHGDEFMPGLIPEPTPCFDLIDDAKSTYELIRQARAKL